MRIGIIGGGPGGLYTAVLAKRLDPRHEVVVWERDAADRTYGFGVIFSDPALEVIGRADPRTRAALEPWLVRWNRMSVHHRGEAFTTAGLGFAAIARVSLLAVLRRWCLRSGVTVLHGRPAPPLERLAAECDLVVAADGAHSATRTGRAGRFGTTLRPCALRYAWLGADRAFDGMSFMIAETAGGPVVAHAYPYADGRSTFLVEARADAAPAQESVQAPAVDRIARLFGEHLGGASLTAGRSRWSRFAVVRNRTWWDGNVVLLGDAAHTTHYSIGSGTALAMGDAVALTTALREHSGLPAALAAYEAARRPVAERMQQVAQASLEWFEGIDAELAAGLPGLATALFTRGGRVSLADVRDLEDPADVTGPLRAVAAGR
ncbi:2-polyprenyl-6-methoxyphenol hydroxylase [Thermomonospora echinospora]|uniref:2-polyprenyl-6-methoxyphenol hydroxylase n=1 Tax=Thermomonospora echinospora TaxID=1992 RepID=A0A1H6DEK7_9ACTN|nr:FAD-dependent monooxygenase [Thermomonospora echinospora]SEG83651.1 2-polyprenyl-6-methoxyphenol hydroxylase [Thermomonospora echinospora]